VSGSKSGSSLPIGCAYFETPGAVLNIVRCRQNLLKILSVIDIHCHILPEVDDGPKSWETSEAMCRMASQDGIEQMVATPHANDRYYYDRAYLAQLLKQLQQRIGPSPQLSLGCDFHLSFENMQAALEKPERWCIGNTHYLLVEFNNFSIPPQMDDWLANILESLDARGILDDTLVIVTSDHGENFGEGGLIGHGFSLDERLVHVPFVASGPGSERLKGFLDNTIIYRILKENL